MVCALAIVAMLATLALPAFPHHPTRARIEGYALEIASLLIEDRASAMRRGVDVSSRLDAATRTIASGGGDAVVRLPAEIDFDATLAGTCAGRATPSAIVFLANGMSCGGVIYLGRGEIALRVNVDWLTGAVDVRSIRDNRT